MDFGASEVGNQASAWWLPHRDGPQHNKILAPASLQLHYVDSLISNGVINNSKGCKKGLCVYIHLLPERNFEILEIQIDEHYLNSNQTWVCTFMRRLKKSHHLSKRHASQGSL